MTPSGIEPATFRFVAQHLKQCGTAVPYFALILFFKPKGMSSANINIIVFFQNIHGTTITVTVLIMNL